MLPSFQDLELPKAAKIATLKTWCKINSGSNNLAGLDKMRTLISKAFAHLSDTIETVNFPPINTQQIAPGLLISKRKNCQQRVLLVGHMDTVYPFDSDFQQLRLIDKNTLNGPGVADMKGGILVMLTALEAFEKWQISKNLGWDVFINTDEEIGSLASSPYLTKLSKKAQVALVFEPALNEKGDLARSRPGSGHFTLLAHGVSAHAGRDFHKGRNAILLLARALLEINLLQNNHPGLTINPGLIKGGTALNQVPDLASSAIEIRLSEQNDVVYIQQALQSIAKKLSKDGLKLEIKGHFHRPIKIISKATELLFAKTQELAKLLNLDLNWQNTGGCCDGNQLAQHVAVLDTLGVRGGKIHTHDEYICLDSIVERSKITALLLYDLALNGTDGYSL